MRIHGRIGDWPVDLTVELNAQEWAHLAEGLAPIQRAPAKEGSTPTQTRNDPLWASVLALMEREQRIDGPRLLNELESLTGNVGAAKQLIVRLRHNANIRIEKAEESQVFVWTGAGQPPAPCKD
jgi:hypothetical protein